MTTMIRHLELAIQELEKKSEEAYYDYKKELNNHNNERRKYYPLRMQEWYDLERGIYDSYNIKIKEIKEKIKLYRKNLIDEKNKLEAANILLKLSKSTKKRKLHISEEPIRKSKRIAEKQLNAVH